MLIFPEQMGVKVFMEGNRLIPFCGMSLCCHRYTMQVEKTLQGDWWCKHRCLRLQDSSKGGV